MCYYIKHSISEDGIIEESKRSGILASQKEKIFWLPCRILISPRVVNCKLWNKGSNNGNYIYSFIAAEGEDKYGKGEWKNLKLK